MECVLDTPICKRVCACMDEARSAGSSSAASAAVSAALRALTAFVHCPKDPAYSSDLSSHFPIAASGVLSGNASNSATGSGGDGVNQSQVSVRHQDSSRASVAEVLVIHTQAVGAIRQALQKVYRSVIHTRPFTDSHVSKCPHYFISLCFGPHFPEFYVNRIQRKRML